MRKVHNFFTSLGLVGYVTYFLLCIVLLIGWFLNIGKLVGLRHSDEITVEIIIRIIGVFGGPLGGIMGWL